METNLFSDHTCWNLWFDSKKLLVLYVVFWREVVAHHSLHGPDGVDNLALQYSFGLHLLEHHFEQAMFNDVGKPAQWKTKSLLARMVVERPKIYYKYCFQLPNSFVVTEKFQNLVSRNHEIWPAESAIFEAVCYLFFSLLSVQGVKHFVESILRIGQ